MVFTGDTGPCLALEEFAKNADLLVGELFDTELVMNSAACYQSGYVGSCVTSDAATF